VGCGIHYPVPIHLQKAYAWLGHKEGSFPVAERRCRELLSLPMYPELTAEQVQFAAAALLEFMENRRGRKTGGRAQ
jgi:dTDP-4-amino-4,6-dideoxygalactose transaminase